MRTIAVLCLLLICGIAHGEPFPWDLQKDPQFSKLYRGALGQRLQAPWLAKLSGPSSPAEHVIIGGHDFLFIHSCKPHNCDTHNLVILYSSKSRTLYGLLVEEGVSFMFGNPPPAIEAELHRLYSQRFGASSYGKP